MKMKKKAKDRKIIPGRALVSIIPASDKDEKNKGIQLPTPWPLSIHIG